MEATTEEPLLQGSEEEKRVQVGPQQQPKTKEIIDPDYPLLKANRDVIESIKRCTFEYKSGASWTLELDVYYPPEERPEDDKRSTKFPILVFFYGGGLVRGARSSPPAHLVYNNVGAFFASRGILTVIPDYRLVPTITYPEGSEDLHDAIVWIIQNLSKGDPRRLYILAHSAGAIHMAGLLLNPRLFQPLGEAIRGIALMGFPCTISPARAELYSNALKYYGSAKVVSKEQPLGLLKRTSEKYISTLPPIQFLIAGSEPKAISVTMRTFSEVFKQKGGKITVLVLHGHDHLSPVLALSSGSGEEWGEELVRSILESSGVVVEDV